jgi:hypothetical protein
MSKELLLYGLRRPFTGLALKESGANTDITVEIHGAFSGVLRVSTANRSSILLDAFADIDSPHVAVIENSGVEWVESPWMHDVLIDGDGNLHYTKDLSE